MSDLVECEICGKKMEKRGMNGHMRTHQKKKADIEKDKATTKIPDNVDSGNDTNDTKNTKSGKSKDLYEQDENGNFIKRVQIEPDKELLTEETDDEEPDEEYQCGSCGHKWKAPADEYQERCPNCMVEFE